jgi:hypothetical protein
MTEELHLNIRRDSADPKHNHNVAILVDAPRTNKTLYFRADLLDFLQAIPSSHHFDQITAALERNQGVRKINAFAHIPRNERLRGIQNCLGTAVVLVQNNTLCGREGGKKLGNIFGVCTPECVN